MPLKLHSATCHQRVLIVTQGEVMQAQGKSSNFNYAQVNKLIVPSKRILPQFRTLSQELNRLSLNSTHSLWTN